MLTKLHTVLAAALLSLSGFGCQCCCVTETWNDMVDCMADIEPNVDCCYSSCLDLTRINRADGWQCGCQCPAPVMYRPIHSNRWADSPSADAVPTPTGDDAVPQNGGRYVPPTPDMPPALPSETLPQLFENPTSP